MLQIQAVAGRRTWLAGVFLLAVLAGCGRGDALEGAASEPASAVTHLARQLAEGDLTGFARDAVTPDRHAALARAWDQGDSLWPLTSLPLDEHLPGLLDSLAAADAERSLRRSFDTQLAGQTANVRQTAQSLGLFGVQYVTHQGGYSPDQQQHYRQLVEALSQWAMQAPLAERAPAHQAIARLVAATAQTGLGGVAGLQAAGMTGALQALSPLQAAWMDVLAGYGLDIRAALAGLQAGLLSEQGDRARVQVQYTLAGQTIRFEADMQKHAGRWYMTQNLADADGVLTAAQQARAARSSGDTQNTGATDMAEGDEAGRAPTNEQMAPAP